MGLLLFESNLKGHGIDVTGLEEEVVESDADIEFMTRLDHEQLNQLPERV